MSHCSCCLITTDNKHGFILMKPLLTCITWNNTNSTTWQVSSILFPNMSKTVFNMNFWIWIQLVLLCLEFRHGHKLKEVTPEKSFQWLSGQMDCIINCWHGPSHVHSREKMRVLNYPAHLDSNINNWRHKNELDVLAPPHLEFTASSGRCN